MPGQATVALYSGLIVDGDAISASLRAKLAALRMAQSRGLDAEVVAFCQYTNVDDPAIRVVPRVPDLLTTPGFREVSLHVFEFGIHYQLFNVAHLLRPEQMAAVYHNITPRELIVDPVVQAAVDRSLLQKHLLARMSHVACVSEFNRQDLLEFGLPADRLSVLPLPAYIEGDPPPPRGGRPAADPIRFLFVGRLVRAKGVLDLLSTIQSLLDSGQSGFEVRVVGRTDGSDTATTERIAEALGDSRMAGALRFQPDASSDDLTAAYREADVFVLPSYHEGYCVPIVEAYLAGCPVIAYDNTNIPYVSGGLAHLVATGDVAALAKAMQGAIDDLRAARQHGGDYRVSTATGAIAERQWRERVRKEIWGLRVAHDEGFVALVQKLLQSRSQPLVPA